MYVELTKSPVRVRTFRSDFDDLAVLPRPRRAVLAFVLMAAVWAVVSIIGGLWFGITGTGLLLQVLPAGLLDGTVLGLPIQTSWKRLVESFLFAFALSMLLQESRRLIVIARWIGGDRLQTEPRTR